MTSHSRGGNNLVSDIRKNLETAYKKAEEDYLSEKNASLEAASYTNRQAMAWKVIDEITGRNEKDAQVPLKGSIEERKSQWFNHFSNLLGKTADVPNDDFQPTRIVEETLPTDFRIFHDLTKNSYDANEKMRLCWLRWYSIGTLEGRILL